MRFSLLPEQQPLDDSCYLQMNLTTKADEAGNLQVLDSSSELWIYGQKAKWQENYSPALSQQGDTCELYCSGYYEIVVSCWDTDLRRALENMGGEAQSSRPSPWALVYRGTRTFEQQLPLECFMGW